MDLHSPIGRRTLGARVQAAVAEGGYASLAVFAEELGCSRALIYQYANGDVLVQLDRLQTIAQLTGKPLEWFFRSDSEVEEALELRGKLDEAEAAGEAARAALARERGTRLAEGAQHREAVIGLHRDLCLAHRRAGDAAAALEVGARWLALAEQVGDEGAEMDAHLQMGHSWIQTGENDRAKEALAAALALAQAREDSRAEESIRQELIRCLQTCGRIDEAREAAQALAGSKRWWPRWSGQLSLAALAEQCGDLKEAESRLKAAEKAIVGDGARAEYVPLARAYLESNRVSLLMARGSFRDALGANEGFRMLAEQAGLPDQMREAALNEAICLVQMDKPEAAGEIFERLREWAELSGDGRLLALVHRFESERQLRYSDIPEAKTAARAALDAATEAASGHAMAEADLALGRVFLRGSAPGDARYYLERAERRAGRLKLRRLQVEAEFSLAYTAFADGDEEAYDLLTEVARAAVTVGYVDIYQKAAQDLLE